jgi:ABC-type transport system substrate-binding protein
MNNRFAPHRSLLIAGLLAVVAATACASGAAPSSAPPASATPPPSAGADLPGGGSGSDPGTGSGGPVDPGPVDPGSGQAAIVMPRPGQLNPRSVGATLLEPSVDGRRVLVKVSWYSGVEPCNVLDSVKVDRGGNEFVLTIIEGSGDMNAVCIEIAQYKATIVDLGELEPGEYTIHATEGEAPPVTVTVS